MKDRKIETKYSFKANDRVTVLTGAGISAESGLRTFRDNNGLWEEHRVEEVATPEAFAIDPALVWKFYKMRYEQLAEVKPNAAHRALSRLEKYIGENFCLITQNVDGLHRQSGSRNIIEMHGSLQKCFCSVCRTDYEMEKIDLSLEIPVCPECGGDLRPDIRPQ